MIREEVLGIGLLSPVLDDGARALDNLLSVALAVQLAETNPLAELLAISHLLQGRGSTRTHGLPGHTRHTFGDVRTSDVGR